MVVFSEFRRGASFLTFEYTVEITQVVKAAIEGYFRNAATCVYQQSGGIAQSYVDDIF